MLGWFRSLVPLVVYVLNTTAADILDWFARVSLALSLKPRSKRETPILAWLKSQGQLR